MPTFGGIHKIGGVIVAAGRLLVVEKQTNPGVYILPGGKPEPGEYPRATLARELEEELAVSLASAIYMGRFRDIAHFEDLPLCMDVYVAQIKGIPAPNHEIAKIRWIDPNYRAHGIIVGSVVSAHLIPALVARRLM